MLALKSPAPSRLRRQFILASQIGGAVLAACVGALSFAQLVEAWRDAEHGDLVGAALTLFLAIVGMIATGSKIGAAVAGGARRKGIFATWDTLAMKTEGAPAAFYRRCDITALGHDGALLEQRNGDNALIAIPGVGRVETDAFLAKLYDLWWPGVALPAVQEYLRETKPADWKGFAASTAIAVMTLTCVALAILLDLRLLWLAGALFGGQVLYLFAVEMPRGRKIQAQRRYPLSAESEFAKIEEVEYAED